MNLATEHIAGCEARPGKPVRVRRTDGSNRTHQALCTGTHHSGLEMQSDATFAVGEVIELLADGNDNLFRESRARIQYRRMDAYGLAWLPEPIPEPAALPPPRLAARKLLSKLKATYDSLPPRQRAAVRTRGTNSSHRRVRKAGDQDLIAPPLP